MTPHYIGRNIFETIYRITISSSVMITELEKRIYNSWLATTRSRNGKPFKLRKKWDKFEDKPEYIHIKKLAKMFQLYDNIDMNEWFTAPYEVYQDNTQYDLKHYTLLKSFTCYKIYKQRFKGMTDTEFKKTLKK